MTITGNNTKTPPVMKRRPVRTRRRQQDIWAKRRPLRARAVVAFGDGGRPPEARWQRQAMSIFNGSDRDQTGQASRTPAELEEAIRRIDADGSADEVARRNRKVH